MSGAEVLAVIGIIANVAQLVDASVKIVERVSSFCRDVNELPKSLQKVQLRFPLLASALRKRSDEEVIKRLSEEDQKSLLNVIHHLEKQAQDLKVILDNIFPPQDAAQWRKALKAMGSFRQEKKVEEIVQDVEGYFKYLMLNDLPVIIPVRSQEVITPRKPLFMLSITRDDEFIGREDTMSLLTAKLSGGQNRIALVALGGLGKTRVALEYALKFKNSPDTSVFWIHASSKARILDAYGKIAKRANIIGYENPETGGPRLVKEWFESDASGRWLIIIDNADDRSLMYEPARLSDYFPRSDNGSIIMTTRDKQVGISFAGPSRLILLQPLSSDQSQNLLNSKFSDPIDPSSSKALADELEGIPLAIVQAAAFIHGNSIDVDSYLGLYRESSSSQVALLSEDFEDSIRDRESKNPIAATWYISFEHIERQTPLAGELLKKMSMLDPQAIPLSLLQSEGSQHELVKALGVLQAFSLISPRLSTSGNAKVTPKSYDLHRLVRLAMRNWLKINNKFSFWIARTLKDFTTIYPDIEQSRWKEKDVWAAYLPHAVAMLTSDELKSVDDQAIAPVFETQKMLGQHADDSVPCAVCASKLMMKVSFSYGFSENKTDSSSWAKKAFSLRAFVLSEQHSETIEALIRIAECLYLDGQIKEAQMIGQQAIGLIDSCEQPPHLVAWKFYILGLIMLEEGLLDDAEAYTLKALNIRQDLWGPENFEVLRCCSQLGKVYLSQGRYEEAEKMYHETMNAGIKAYGPEDPDTFTTMSDLAVVYTYLGRWDEAAAIDMKINNLRTSLLGPKHPDTIFGLINMTILHVARERYDEAINLGLKALELGTEVMGPDDMVVLTAMSYLAISYQAKGQLDKAEEYSVRVVDCNIRLRGDQHTSTIFAMRDLATLYENQERYKKAGPLREKLVEVETKKLGAMNAEVILSRIELGLNYSSQKLDEKASKYNYSAAAFPLTSKEAKRQEIIQRMVLVADGWLTNDNLSESEKIARDAAELAREYLNPTQDARIGVLVILAIICRQANLLDESEQLFREVLGLQLSESGIRPSFPASIRTQFALVLIRQVHYAEAEAIALEAKEMLSKIPDAPTTKKMISFNTRVLGDLYKNQGRFTESETHYATVLKQQTAAWKPEEATLFSSLGVVNGLESLGNAYNCSERFPQAHKLFSKVLSMRAKLEGSGNRYTVRAKALLRDTLNYQERYEEALAMGLECKDQLQAFGLVDHDAKAWMAAINLGIAISYIGLKRFQEAEPIAKETLEQNLAMFGGRGLSSLDAEYVLAIIFSEQGGDKLEEAENIGKRVVDLRTEMLGEKHLGTLNAMTNLAKTYEKMGRENEAKALEVRVAELRKTVDFGLDGEKEKEVEELVDSVFQKWDDNQDLMVAALAKLSLA